MQNFQAWEHDDAIAALRRMGLLIRHENTSDSRCEIFHHVWNKIRTLSAAEKAKLPNKTPWDQVLESERI
jgi:hypothetical protein